MSEVEALRRENALLHARLSMLLASNAQLTEQIGKLTERVTELLAVAQRRQRKPSPEKPPEPKPDVVGDAKRAFDERPKAPDAPTRLVRDKKPAVRPCPNTSRPTSTRFAQRAARTAGAPRSMPLTRSWRRSFTS